MLVHVKEMAAYAVLCVNTHLLFRIQILLYDLCIVELVKITLLIGKDSLIFIKKEIK